MTCVIWLLGVLCVHLPRSVAGQCREPQDLSQQLDKLTAEILNMTLTGTPTFGTIPEYRRAFKTISSSSQKRKYRIYGESKCKSKKLVNIRGKQHINYKSTCPWYVYLDYDVDRLPQAMAKAKCSCKKCFNVFSSRRNSEKGSCEKIKSYVPVIRRQCSINMVYEYAVYMEMVPVGCTCKRNVIATS